MMATAERGYSGARLNRPGLDQLREHAAMAAFQIVLIAYHHS